MKPEEKRVIEAQLRSLKDPAATLTDDRSDAAYDPSQDPAEVPRIASYKCHEIGGGLNYQIRLDKRTCFNLLISRADHLMRSFAQKLKAKGRTLVQMIHVRDGMDIALEIRNRIRAVARHAFSIRYKSRAHTPPEQKPREIARQTHERHRKRFISLRRHQRYQIPIRHFGTT